MSKGILVLLKIMMRCYKNRNLVSIRGVLHTTESGRQNGIRKTTSKEFHLEKGRTEKNISRNAKLSGGFRGEELENSL